MSTMGWGHVVLLLVPRNLSVGGGNHVHMVPIYVTDGICARPHRGIPSSGGSICTSNTILSSPALGSSTTSAFATVPRTRRRCRRLMKLLLMSQQQVPPSKASCTFWALEWFLFGVGTLVTFQMFQSGKRTLASSTDMRTRLVGLGWRKLLRRSRGGGSSSSSVHRNRRGFR